MEKEFEKAHKEEYLETINYESTKNELSCSLDIFIRSVDNGDVTTYVFNF